MISVSYFGTKSPPNGDALGESKPLWSKTWDRSPFDKGTIVDWKTGTIRSPLFDPDKPDDQRGLILSCSRNGTLRQEATRKWRYSPRCC